MSVISVLPPRRLSGRAQWTNYLLLFREETSASANAFWMSGFLKKKKKFESPLCHAFSPCSCSLMALHAHLCTDVWLWFHLWAEYHCNVCLPSWLLHPYCPLALCARAFCVSLAGIGLFTVIKWEQRRLVDWTVTLLEWGKLQCTLQ